MNFKQIFKPHIFLLLSLVGIILSCNKDLGNYNYRELNKFVEVSNLPEEMVATYGKQLVFIPDVKFTLDPDFDASKYSYRWTYIGPNGVGGTTLHTLSTEKDLNFLLTTVTSGTYTAYFNVKETASGIEYKQSFKLKVVNELNEGWIMMNEANGKARLDMLSLGVDNNFTLVTDLLTTVGSELKLEGKPIMIYNYNTGLLIGPDKISHGLYVGTDKGTTKIEPNTFKWTPTMALSYEMFGETPSGFYAELIRQKSANSAYLIGNESAYYYERVQNVYFSAPISYVSEEKKEFKVAPFVGTTFSFGILYDKTNRRFVKHSGTASSCTVIPEQPADQRLFTFNTGKDLQYMRQVSFNGGEVFAILKDPINTKSYLARFNPANNAQTYYAEITGTDFSKAEHFAISPEFGYIFYSVSGKVYEYDMVYKTAKLMADYGTKKISYLNFYEFLNTGKYKDGNKLMVGTYDPSKSDGTEGSLDIYTVPGINGDLVLDKSFSGFGRIKSLTYRER